MSRCNGEGICYVHIAYTFRTTGVGGGGGGCGGGWRLWYTSGRQAGSVAECERRSDSEHQYLRVCYKLYVSHCAAG